MDSAALARPLSSRHQTAPCSQPARKETTRTTPTPPPWQTDRLATLLDALDGVPNTDEEWRILTWLAGWEHYIVENVAAVITRARHSSVAEVGPSPEAFTVITSDDEPQVRGTEFIRLVRAGHDVDEVGALLGIEGGKFPRS